MPAFYSRNLYLFRRSPDIVSSGGGQSSPIAIVAGSPYAQISSTNSTTYTISLNGVQYAQGDMIIIFFTGGKNGVITPPSGWNQLTQTNYGGVVTGAVFYKFATTSETNPSFVSTITCQYSSHIWVVRGTNLMIESAVSTGANLQADPPLLTPSGGLKNYLWFAVRSGDYSIPATTTSAPTGYSGFTVTEPTVASTDGGSTASAWKQSLATSENPDIFNGSEEQWVATTVGIWQNG